MRKDSEVIASRPFPCHNRTVCPQSRKNKHRAPIEIKGKTCEHQLRHISFYDRFVFSTTMVFFKGAAAALNKIFLKDIVDRLNVFGKKDVDVAVLRDGH